MEYRQSSQVHPEMHQKLVKGRMIDFIRRHNLQLLFIAVIIAIVLIHLLPMMFPPYDFPGDFSYGCPGY